MKTSTNVRILFIASVILYIFAYNNISSGYDKMFNYSNPDSEFSFLESENAYVGGDAYNYIINAGYATAYFVLAGAYGIIATLLLVGGLVISSLPEALRSSTLLVQEKPVPNTISDLPPL